MSAKTVTGLFVIIFGTLLTCAVEPHVGGCLILGIFSVSAVYALFKKRPSCADCGQSEGKPHKPSCHRKGVVTSTSVDEAFRA